MYQARGLLGVFVELASIGDDATAYMNTKAPFFNLTQTTYASDLNTSSSMSGKVSLMSASGCAVSSCAARI